MISSVVPTDKPVCRALPYLLILMCLLLPGPARTEEPAAPLLLTLRSRDGGRGHGGHGAARHEPGHRGDRESEHVPLPVRSYLILGSAGTGDLEAILRRPGGEHSSVPVLKDDTGPYIEFPTPPGDGPCHGPNTVAVVERRVRDETLQIRVAQWLTIHHNCGWGHDQKFNADRLTPRPFGDLPMEIVTSRLWDPNFHVDTKSGDTLRFRVLSHGAPLPGAELTLTSEHGWRKQLVTDDTGTAAVQMIRDYYPTGWDLFNRGHRGRFLVTARYEWNTGGVYDGRSYERQVCSVTFPWKYTPARRDYLSLAGGLATGMLGLTAGGFGVFFYRERRRRPYRQATFND